MALTRQRTLRGWRALALSASGALATGLLSGAWWLLEPAWDHLSEARRHTAALTAELERQQTRLADRPALHAALEQLETRAARHHRQLPTQASQQPPLATLTAMADQAALDLERFAPSEPVTTAGEQHLPLTVVLRGSWRGLVGWIAQLTRQPRLITVERLELERAGPDAPADDLRLTAQLAAHWRPPSVPESTKRSWPQASALMTPLWMTPWDTHQPAALQRNPFTGVNAPTQRLALDGPRYLGRIIRGERRWGLVRHADGEVRRLRAGQRLDMTLPDGTALRVSRVGADALHLTPTDGAGAPIGADPIHLPLDRHP